MTQALPNCNIDILLQNYAIKTWFTVSPYLISASALLGKTESWKLHVCT